MGKGLNMNKYEQRLLVAASIGSLKGAEFVLSTVKDDNNKVPIDSIQEVINNLRELAEALKEEDTYETIK